MRLIIFVKSKYLAKWKDKNGKTRYRYKPLVGPKSSYGTVTGEMFVKARDLKLSPKHKGFVTKYTPKEYAEKGAKMFVSPDGNSGYAITKTGDLI
ncbi:hypothetical protein KA005_16010 [bacterium]|nr:hypothetical protein [bacterium]